MDTLGYSEDRMMPMQIVLASHEQAIGLDTNSGLALRAVPLLDLLKVGELL